MSYLVAEFDAKLKSITRLSYLGICGLKECNEVDIRAAENDENFENKKENICRHSQRQFLLFIHVAVKVAQSELKEGKFHNRFRCKCRIM